MIELPAGPSGGVCISRFRLALVVATLVACGLVAWPSSGRAKEAGPAGGGAVEADGIPFILGGESVKPGELPSLAFVAYLIPDKGEGIVCTGTVVAPRLVLTAAHCARPRDVPFDVENLRVVTGNVNWKADDRRVLHVVRAMSYPRRDLRGHRVDAALLELAEPARVPSLPLARRAFWSPGSRAEMAGWGVLDPSQQGATYVLHRAPTIVLGFKECSKHGGYQGRLCAEDAPSYKTSACYGDSGGPLLIRRPSDRKLTVIGVAHGGDYCNLKSPTYYTSTVPIFNWVRARMAEAGRVASSAGRSGTVQVRNYDFTWALLEARAA